MTTFANSSHFFQNLLAVRQWEEAHLPLDGSLLAFDLLTVTAHHTMLGQALNLKQLNTQMNYSEAGVRKQLKRCLEQGWLELQAGQNDKRVKYVVATPKLLKILSNHAQFLSNIYQQPHAMTPVDVYADLACTKLLATVTVPEQFAPESEDFNDGQDWWNRVLVQVEQAYGSRWQSFVVRDLDGQQGRRFNRRQDTPEPQTVFLPRIFGFSKSTVHQQQAVLKFSQVRFYDLSLFDFGRYYLDGTDERIIQHLASVFACIHEQFAHVMVLDQPVAVSTAELQESFQLIHAIPVNNQAHCLALANLDAALNQLYQLKREAQDIAELMKDLGLDGVNHADQLEQSLASHLSKQYLNFQTEFSVR